MAGFSTYLAQKIIDHTLRGSSYSMPSTLYLALFTADPTDNNVTANEATGAWYGRVATGSWSAAVGSGNASSNNNAIVFNAVTGSTISISHWGIYDASTSGNLLYSDSFPASRVLNVGDIATVAASGLTLTFS